MFSADLSVSYRMERENELGGQLRWTYGPINNYLGCEAANGGELADRFEQHVANARVRRITGCEVIAADLKNKTVTTSEGITFSGKAIVIATGVTRRKLGIPGEAKFVGRGILESGAKSKHEVTDKRVVIVGGGDAALENALILSETASKVIVIQRRNEFSARCEFVEQAISKPNIEFVLNQVITTITGNQRLNGAALTNLKTGQLTKIAADALLIRIGIRPNTEIFHGKLEFDDADYILTNHALETSIIGVFAIGDVSNPGSLTIATAVGNAGTAIKRIYQSLKMQKSRN